MWAFNLVPLVFFLFNLLFFDVFFFRLRLSLVLIFVFSFFLFDIVFSFRFSFCLAVIRFFITGVVVTEGVPVSAVVTVEVAVQVGVVFLITHVQ